MIFKFTVLGRAEPQGSMKAFMIKGKPVLTSDNAKMKPWRQQVGWVALEARGGSEMAPRGIPVALEVIFYFRKPTGTSHRQFRPTKKPDLDKLCRALCDALKGVLYEDDSQITGLIAQKHFGLPERAEVIVKVP